MALNSSIHIAGGGIGGLAAAAALGQRGAKVTVFEQADAIGEVGAGLQISPNGMRVLEGLGLAGAVKARAVIAHAVSLRRAESDREVARVPLAGAGEASAYAFVHRADLIEILLGAAKAAGAVIKLGQSITGAVPGVRPVLQTRGGDITGADLIVDASGLHSPLRSVLNPGSEPFFTGQVAWRALVPNQAQRGSFVHVHMAPGAHVVSYPVRGGEMLNIVAVQERTQWAAEGWAHEDDPDNLRRAFSGAAPAVQEMLARVDKVHLWGLFRHELAQVWTGPNVALLGDAAHPTLPFLAQGAVTPMAMRRAIICPMARCALPRIWV